MAVLPILTWPDARLNAPCAPADPAAVADLARDMLDTMYDAPGRGLAAPQVGHLLRLFVMDTTWKEGVKSPRVMINPRILWSSDETAPGPEGCLSIPGVLAEVSRPVSIRMAWTGLDGFEHEELLSGFDAICAQHEFDHLDGILTFDRLTPEARAELLSRYKAQPDA